MPIPNIRGGNRERMMRGNPYGGNIRGRNRKRGSLPGISCPNGYHLYQGQCLPNNQTMTGMTCHGEGWSADCTGGNPSPCPPCNGTAEYFFD